MKKRNASLSRKRENRRKYERHLIESFQFELSLQTLFQLPTIAEMADVITRYRGKHLSDKEVDRLLAEVEELSDKEAESELVHESTSSRKISREG